MTRTILPWQAWTPAHDRIRWCVIEYRRRYGQVPTRRVVHQATEIRSRLYIDPVIAKLGKRGDLS